MDFARRRMWEISCLTDLGQRCRGIVPLPGVAGGLCGNMVVAVVRASPTMAWIMLARPTTVETINRVSNVSPMGIFPGPWPREARREWPIDLAREVAA